MQGEYDYAVPSAADVKAAYFGDPEQRQRFLVCKGKPKGKLQELIARGLACAVENLIPVDRIQSRSVNHLRPGGFLREICSRSPCRGNIISAMRASTTEGNTAGYMR